MHQVQGNKIVENGQEVVWKGAGGAYNLHGANQTETLNAWQSVYIPLAKQLGINTMRLAFSLPYDPGTIEANENYALYLYNESLMDSVIVLLASNGIKSILDCHMYRMFYPNDTGSTLSNDLLASWENIADRYKNNENIVAYEIFNEPQGAYGSTYRHTVEETAQGYHDLTVAIRSYDSNHICIWESPLTYGVDHYLPALDAASMQGLLLPNIVYTYHVWHMLTTITAMGGPDKASTTDLNALLKFRNTNYPPVGKVPIWVGEFGYESSYPTIDATWDYCKMLKTKCDQNRIGWNLWMGATDPTTPKMLQEYLAMFPSSPPFPIIPVVLVAFIGMGLGYLFLKR